MRTKDRYARLMGRFWRHPKAMACSDSALALWTRALSYTVDQLTDGHITVAVAAQLTRGKPAKAASELVTLGLWVTHESDGWQFHDYADHNITTETWKSEAERNREKAAAYRARYQKSTERVTGNDPGNSQTHDARRMTEEGEPEPTGTGPGELVRSTVVAAFTARKLAAPPATKRVGLDPWTALGRWCRDTAQARSTTTEAIATALVAGFFADQRATAKGYPISFLTANPAEYLAAAPAPVPDPIDLADHAARRKAEAAERNAKIYGGAQ